MEEPAPLRLVDLIAANCRRLRAKEGWSQEKLARRMEMSRETVRSIEAGLGMNVDTLEHLAAAFRVPPSELLREDEALRVFLYGKPQPLLQVI